MRTVFGPEGDIRSTDVLSALVALWREGASGTLQFSRSGATSGFEISAGEIVGSSASEPRFDTAAILVRANKLEESTLERLSAPEGADKALAALQAGVLTRREWRWGEKIRAVEVLSDLLTWIEGDYAFFRTGPRDAGEFRLTIPRLVLELFLRSRDRTLVLHHLGGVDVPLVRDSRFDTEFATFGLTDDAESVVRLIDGESTAAEIAAEAPAEPFAVEKLLAALVTLGLVHPAYAVQDAEMGPSAAGVAGPAEAAAEEEEEVAAEDVASDEPPTDAEGRGEDDDVDEEELEPEVDIDDKVEEPAPVSEPAPELDWERPGSFDAPPPREPAEDLVDADLQSAPGEPGDLDDRDEEEAESESDRLSADLQASQEAAAGFDRDDIDRGGVPQPSLDVETPSSSPFDFQRPLDTTTGVGSLERPRHRSSGMWFLVLGGAVAIAAALLYFRSRGPSIPAEPELAIAATPSPSAVPAEAAVPIPVTAAPTIALFTPRPTAAVATARPTAAPPTVRPTVAAPTPRSTVAAPTPRPTAAQARPAPSQRPTAAPRRPTAPAAAPALPRSRQAWNARAQKDQKTADADRETRFAVQLELVCEIPSLTEAFGHDRPAGTMWVVPTSFRGKSCFRVLWGRYPSREAADRGLAEAPQFFSTPRNHPMVISVR